MKRALIIVLGLFVGCHEANDPTSSSEPELGADNLALACEADLTCPHGGTCDARTLKCVDCLDDGDCAAGVCDPRANVCVQCVDDGDCTSGFCHPTRALCVGCWNDGQCNSGVCDPEQLSCVACLGDQDCASATSAGRCNTTTRQCVGECRHDADCVDNDPCTSETCTSGACAFTKRDGCGCEPVVCTSGALPVDRDNDSCSDGCLCAGGQVVGAGERCPCPAAPTCPLDTRPFDKDLDGCVDACACPNGALLGPDGRCPCPVTIACGGGLVASDLDADGCPETCTKPCATDCDCVAQGLVSDGQCALACASCGPFVACDDGICAGACGVPDERPCQCPTAPSCGPLETAADSDADGCNDTCVCLVDADASGAAPRDPSQQRKCGCPFVIDCRAGSHPVDSDADGCGDTCACDDVDATPLPDGSCCPSLACPPGAHESDKSGDACPDVCVCGDGTEASAVARPCPCLEAADCPDGLVPSDTNNDACADTCACADGQPPGPDGCGGCLTSCADQALPPGAVFVDLDHDGCYDLVDACPVGKQATRSANAGCPDACKACEPAIACPERATPIDSDGDNCADACVCDDRLPAPASGCGCAAEIVCGATTVAIDRDGDGCLDDCVAPCASDCDCTSDVAFGAAEVPACANDCTDCRVVGSCVEGYCAFECRARAAAGPACLVVGDAPVCGCDDQTYDSACAAGQADVQVKRAGACEAGCTSDADCAQGELCELPTGACPALGGPGDQPAFVPIEARGECQSIPSACIADGTSVCGCDGKTYPSDCERRKAGVARRQVGACPVR